VTFTAPWKEQYDQAGLLLVLSPKTGPTTPESRKWIKTGLEFYQGARQLSTVACDAWADWSVTPVPTGPTSGEEESVTVQIEREDSAHGTSLWVFYLPSGGEQGKKVPLREVCWVYGHEPENWYLTVSAYTARPEAKTTKESLDVSFTDLVVEWST
jgi:uncharacterized protein